MSTVTVFQFPRLMQTIELYQKGGALKFVKENFNKYRKVYEAEVTATGTDAAEQMFSLFGEPGEGSDVFRREHSASVMAVGDVVQVDGVRYACLPVGWQEF